MDFIRFIEDKYQFVLIRSAYELMDYQLVRDLFPKIVRFKTEGYRQEYGNFVLPFDSTDFVASHLLLCEKTTDQGLVPVLGFKSVTLAKCEDHRIGFPMLSLLDANDPNDAYQLTMKNILNGYRDRKETHKIAYNGSFTISPRLRENKELMKHLWDISFSLLTNYYIDYDINHVVAICATKFKIHLKKENLGWNFIQGPHGELAPYVCRAFFDSTLVPMELTDVKAKSQRSAEKFKSMWENRITLDFENLAEKKKAA